MKQQVTIKYVKGSPRTFNFGDGKPGASAEFVVLLASGEEKDASVASTPDHVQKHIDALKALEGQTVEVDAEDSQYGLKVKEYPGKPTGGGRGGKGSYRPDWSYESFEERIFVQERITVASAFKTAADVASSAGFGSEAVLDFVLTAGPKLYEAMVAAVPVPAKPAQSAPPAPAQNDAPAGESGGAVSTSDELRTMRGRVLDAYEGKVPNVVAAYKDLTGDDKKFADLTTGDLANILAASV